MANMGTVSVSYQQFRIKRNLQETKKPAHLGKKIAGAAGSKFSFSYPPPKNVSRSSGLASQWKPFSMMGEAHDCTNITGGRTVKRIPFHLRIQL